MTPSEAQAVLSSPSPLVRLKGVRGDKAAVQPFGHRRVDVVPLACVKAWKSAMGV